MLRRQLLAAFPIWTAAARSARGAATLDPFFESRDGAAVLVDVPSRRIVAVHAPDAANGLQLPPGSTLKPFVLAALIATGKLTADEPLVCPGYLTISGRNFNCSHPRLDVPMRVETALAYSCNYFVAHMADRFGPGELAAALARAGLHPGAGKVDKRLLALGEEGILATTVEMAMAYRWLALQSSQARLQPVVRGLEGAVEYGTAQRAGVAGMHVAGKTGSVVAPSGSHVAWFAGFAPSRDPRLAVAVMLAGHSGGGDAAPVAGRILEHFRQ